MHDMLYCYGYNPYKGCTGNLMCFMHCFDFCKGCIDVLNLHCVLARQQAVDDSWLPVLGCWHATPGPILTSWF